MNKIVLTILGLIGLLSVLLLVVIYIMLGIKLTKKTYSAEVRQLGYSFYIVPVAFIISMVFDFIPALKPFHHVFIIFELMPYFIIWRIYSKLLLSLNENSELPAAEDPESSIS